MQGEREREARTLRGGRAFRAPFMPRRRRERGGQKRGLGLKGSFKGFYTGSMRGFRASKRNSSNETNNHDNSSGGS